VSLRDQLQAIYDQHGRLTPALVVEEARAEDHPLHPRVFDRTSTEAAESWYRRRAHELISSVRIVYREADDSGPERTVRAFHAVPSEGPDEYVYEPVDRVREDPMIREVVLRSMEREWKQLLARYEHMEEFLALVRQDVS
jgi:hypothetical protein